MDNRGGGYEYKQTIMICMNEDVIMKPILHMKAKFLTKNL